jgi:hypothetical protein
MAMLGASSQVVLMKKMMRKQMLSMQLWIKGWMKEEKKEGKLLSFILCLLNFEKKFCFDLL